MAKEIPEAGDRDGGLAMPGQDREKGEAPVPRMTCTGGRASANVEVILGYQAGLRGGSMGAVTVIQLNSSSRAGVVRAVAGGKRTGHSSCPEISISVREQPQ